MVDKATPVDPDRRRQTRDPERTRGLILQAAREHFAAHGLDGARVDAIAEAAGVNKRMIYYYFTDKDGLFVATLEMIYGELSAASDALVIDAPPETALNRYIDYMWDYYRAHPETIAILNSENLHAARHLKQSAEVERLQRPFVKTLETVLDEGAERGVFKPDLNAVNIHITVIALVYLFIGNNATLSVYFRKDLSTAEAQDAWLAHIKATLSALVGT